MFLEIDRMRTEIEMMTMMMITMIEIETEMRGGEMMIPIIIRLSRSSWRSI